MLKHVNASSIIVSNQIVSQGSIHINGGMILGNGASMAVRGGPTLTFDAQGVNVDGCLALDSRGIHISTGTGLSLSTREHVVHHISRDMTQSREIDDDHIPTTRAVREYIDAQGVGAKFACLTIGEIRAHGDNPITIASPVVFREGLAIDGPLRMSYAHLRDSDTPDSCIIDCNKYSLFFMDGARRAKVASPCAREFAYVMQIINISQTVESLINFGQGVASIGAGCAAKFAYLAPSERWICISDPDIFYPTRVEMMTCAFRAESCAISADGRVAIVGTPRDGANGGARILVYRASDNKWICAQVCEDDHPSRMYGRIVMRGCTSSTCARASSSEAIAQQGRVCAINDDGTMIAIASEFAIWLFAITIMSNGSGSSSASQLAQVSIRNVIEAQDDASSRAHEPFATYPGERIEYMAFDNTHRLRAVVASAHGNEAHIVYGDSCDSSAAVGSSHMSGHDALDAFVPDARLAMSSNGQTQIDARGDGCARRKGCGEDDGSDDKCASKKGHVEHAQHTVVVRHDPRTGKIVIIIDLPNAARTVSLCASGAHGLICMENGALAHIY